MKYYKAANGMEYFTKEDADHPRMGGGCIGFRDTAPELTYQPITNLTPNPIAGKEVKLVGQKVIEPIVNIPSDLEDKTLLELQEIAKNKGIKGYQLFKENTLINKIKAAS